MTNYQQKSTVSGLFVSAYNSYFSPCNFKTKKKGGRCVSARTNFITYLFVVYFSVCYDQMGERTKNQRNVADAAKDKSKLSAEEPCNSQVRPGEYSHLVLEATPKLFERSPVDIPEEADVIDDAKPSASGTTNERGGKPSAPHTSAFESKSAAKPR